MFKILYQYLVDLLFPMICEGCGSNGKYLCKLCRKSKIQYIDIQRCHVCKQLISENMVHECCQGNTNIDGVFVVAHYSKFIESYLADIKYNFYYSMLDDIYEIMVNHLIQNQNFVEILQTLDFITYIPFFSQRQRWRGFNQSELLAKKLGVRFDKEFKTVLNRVRNTNSQLGLGRAERLLNIVGCMEYISNENITNSNIIIIDDVYTTGATMEECARVLKEAGAIKVYGVVFARG